jgi:hypothetical protein
VGDVYTVLALGGIRIGQIMNMWQFGLSAYAE